MSRIELAEAAGISVSHLKKIEMGMREPGMKSYQRIMDILGVDIVIRDGATVKGECIAKVQRILMGSTENEVLFMTNLLEFVAGNMELVR